MRRLGRFLASVLAVAAVAASAPFLSAALAVIVGFILLFGVFLYLQNLGTRHMVFEYECQNFACETRSREGRLALTYEIKKCPYCSSALFFDGSYEQGEWQKIRRKKNL